MKLSITAMRNAEQIIKKMLTEAIAIAKGLLVAKAKAQGHVDTGKLVNDIEAKVIKVGRAWCGELWVQGYAKSLENRTPSSRIPFSRGSGASSSKLIQSLVGFWKRKGLSAKEALGAAFATITKWKTEGRPTLESYRYSSNGRRTGLFTHAFNEDNLRKIEAKVPPQKIVDLFQNSVSFALSQNPIAA